MPPPPPPGGSRPTAASKTRARPGDTAAPEHVYPAVAFNFSRRLSERSGCRKQSNRTKHVDQKQEWGNCYRFTPRETCSAPGGGGGEDTWLTHTCFPCAKTRLSEPPSCVCRPPPHKPCSSSWYKSSTTQREPLFVYIPPRTHRSSFELIVRVFPPRRHPNVPLPSIITHTSRVPLSFLFYPRKVQHALCLLLPCPEIDCIPQNHALPLHRTTTVCPGALPRQAEGAHRRTQSRPSTVHWPFCSPSVAPVHKGGTDRILFDTHKKKLSFRERESSRKKASGPKRQANDFQPSQFNINDANVFLFSLSSHLNRLLPLSDALSVALLRWHPPPHSAPAAPWTSRHNSPYHPRSTPQNTQNHLRHPPSRPTHAA
ncbi:unnamed protein product [Ectocarpus fasciculatus]